MGMQPPAITERPATAPPAEHKAWSAPGVVALVAGLAGLCVGIGLLVSSLASGTGSGVARGWATILLVVAALVLSGLVPVVAGEARVVQLFGRYQGTVRDAGLVFVNPFTRRRKVSVRSEERRVGK